MPKSVQRVDRFMPGSASISSYRISPTDVSQGSQREAHKTRSVSGVSLNVISNDAFSFATLPVIPTAPTQFIQEHNPIHLPPAAGPLTRVMRLHQPYPRERSSNRGLIRGISPQVTEPEDGPNGNAENIENLDDYKYSIAGALGLRDTRVFMYNTSMDKKRNIKNNFAGGDLEIFSKPSIPVKKESTKKVLSHIPYRILDAPGLRNDFYANLVAWSSKSGQIAVGLLDEVFIWTEFDGAAQIAIPANYGEVTCLVFSCENILAVGHRDGTVVFFDVDKKRVAATYIHVEGPVCFLAWFPEDPNQILIGDEIGNAIHIEIVWGPQTSSTVITKRATLKGHTQQICGMYIAREYQLC